MGMSATVEGCSRCGRKIKPGGLVTVVYQTEASGETEPVLVVKVNEFRLVFCDRCVHRLLEVQDAAVVSELITEEWED
jgi:hypothetical protein